MAEQMNVLLDLIGDPASIVPKKVNLFTLQNSEDGILLNAIYNTKQIDKQPDGSLHSRAYIAQQMLVSPQDLDALSKIIKKHLSQHGYYENPNADEE